jgi:hypothetical protein
LKDNLVWKNRVRQLEAELAGVRSELARERARRQKDVGSQEYRGNTVSYIYDKEQAYGKKFDEMNAELAILREAVKRRDAVIEWIILNGLPGLFECDCHVCQEQRRDCIAAKLKEGAK